MDLQPAALAVGRRGLLKWQARELHEPTAARQHRAFRAPPAQAGSGGSGPHGPDVPRCAPAAPGRADGGRVAGGGLHLWALPRAHARCVPRQLHRHRQPALPLRVVLRRVPLRLHHRLLGARRCCGLRHCRLLLLHGRVPRLQPTVSLSHAIRNPERGGALSCTAPARALHRHRALRQRLLQPAHPGQPHPLAAPRAGTTPPTSSPVWTAPKSCKPPTLPKLSCGSWPTPCRSVRARADEGT